MNAPIAGATTILAPLQILNNPDLPIADMQHIKGGGWSLADTAARDLIPAALRQKDVTRCYVEADDKTYVLRGGIANSNWVVAGNATGSGTGSGKLLNKFLATLQLTVGQSFTVDLPSDLFGPSPIVYSTLEAQNLPDGLTLSAPARISGIPTASGNGLILLNAFLSTGEHLQYVLAYKVADVATVVATVGVVNIDVSFGAMDSANPTQLLYDFDLALQLNEPGIAENGQRALPGVSTRFIGDATVTGCVAIAAIAKQTVPGNNLIRFYRFGINVARLRSLYPAQLQIHFDVRGKRKSANPPGLGNGVYFRVGRDKTAGLVSAAQPIGFASNNPTAVAPDDYNNSGNLYGIGETETVIGQFIVTLADGATTFIPVATAPTAPAVLSIPTILPTGTQDGMQLTWNGVTGGTSYETQYATTNDAVGNSATTSGLSRTVTGLLAGTTYYSRVRAKGANGALSDWSAIVSVAPGGQITVIDNINTAQAWIVQEGYSRDGSSLDTSIWIKGLTPNQNYEVALVRQDGNAVSGQNWTSGVFGAVELATSLSYSIDPYTAVKRFNKGSGTGVTPGIYNVLVRRPEQPLVVLSQQVTFGGSTNGIALIAQYQPPAQSGGGGTAVTVITPSTATPNWLQYVGWNRDVSGGSSDGETNVFWDSTEPLKARILENGAAVSNASWANPAQFMSKYTGDSYVPGGHNARVRLLAGILEGHTYSIELIRESNPSDTPFTVYFNPVREAGIHPITLPTGNASTGGGGTGTTPVNNSTTGYDGGTADTVTGLTDPDGQAADTGVVDPNTEY